MRLSFRLENVNLAGEPREYKPRLAIWSTDRERMKEASSGMAVAIVELDRKYEGVRSIDFTGDLPIDRDPHADLCVAVYALTRETGYSDTLTPVDRPNTIRMGQVNINWFGLMKHMTDTKAKVLSVSAPVMSLAAYDGILYHAQFDVENEVARSNDANFVRIAKRAKEEATRATLIIDIEVVSDETRSLIRKRVRKMSDTTTQQSETMETDYATGLDKYLKFYHTIFPREGHGTLVYPTPAGKTVHFEPDTPSMERFHLPIWSTGVDRIPFCEWWRVTICRPHTSDLTTQAFFRNLANAGIARAMISEERVCDTVTKAFLPGTPAKTRRDYATKGTQAYNNLMRAVEATYLTCTSLALAFHYASDGRYVLSDTKKTKRKKNKDGEEKVVMTIERIPVEDPQQDIVSGLSRSADCEDLEKVIAICANLLARGLSETQDWTDPLLSAMRTVTTHYLNFHTFGTVHGAKLSDAATGEGSHAALGADTLLVGDNKTPTAPVMTSVFGLTIPTEPVDVADEQMNPRRHWLSSFIQHRGLHYLILDAFRSAYPNLWEGIKAQMPYDDRSLFWRDLVLWLDHYISIRTEIVLRNLDLPDGIYLHALDENRVVVRSDAVEDETVLDMQEAEQRYNDGQPFYLTPAKTPGALDDIENYGGDLWTGAYDEYDLHSKMHRLFQLANLLFSWYVSGKDNASRLALSKLTFTENVMGDVKDVSYTEESFLALVADFVRDVKTYGPPQEPHEPQSILSHQNVSFLSETIGSAGCRHHRHHHHHHKHGAMKLSNDQLSDGALACIKHCRSVSELRTHMTADVKREARKSPRLFWVTVLRVYHAHWARFALTLLTLTKHHHLDDALHRLVTAREKQFGAYRMWRNAMLWIEWFDARLANIPALRELSLSTVSHAERHALVKSMVDIGCRGMKMHRRLGAKCVIKGLLCLSMLNEGSSITKTADHVQLAYKHASKALGVLNAAPITFHNKRDAVVVEEKPVRYRFERYIPPPAQITDTKTSVLTSVSRTHPEMVTSVNALHTMLLGLVDEDDAVRADLTRNLIGWVDIYCHIKLEFLVHRLNLRDQTLTIEENDSRIRLDDGSNRTLTRIEFLDRLYRTTDAGSVTLTSSERLDFYARVRRHEPEGGDILIAMDRFFMLGVDNMVTQSLTENGLALARILATELSTFHPIEHRAPHHVLVVQGSQCRFGVNPADLVADTLSAADLAAIDELSTVPTSMLWSTVADNTYLTVLERTHRLLFWAQIVQRRLPLLYAAASKVFDWNALAKYALPSPICHTWRNLYPWLIFYVSVLFTTAIERLGLSASYVYVDVNAIRSRLLGTTLTFDAFIRETKVAASPEAFMRAGLTIPPNRYDTGNTERLELLNRLIVRLFSDTDNTFDESFNADMVRFGNVILRESITPAENPMASVPEALTSASRAGMASRSTIHVDDKYDSIEDDDALIDTRADHEANIGGHMFAIFAPSMHLDSLYRKHTGLMDELCGADGPHVSLSAHVDASLARMVGSGSAVSDEDLRSARAILNVLPVLVAEGTGRQELLLLPLEHYFEASQELLQRSAQHVASASLLDAWQRTEINKVNHTARPGVSSDMYGFQSHLFSNSMIRRDPLSGRVYERRLTSFYRRLGHGFCEQLFSIDARFRHLIWIRPECRHFGANLRHFVTGGDAMPIPAPEGLANTYLSSELSAKALDKRGQHITPYHLCFSTEQEDGDDARLASGLDIHPHGGRVAPFSITSKFGNIYKPQEPFTFDVPSSSPLATAIRDIAGHDVNEWETQATGSMFMSEPREDDINSLASEFGRSVGAHTVSVEHLLPMAPVVLRFECERTIKFRIQD